MLDFHKYFHWFYYHKGKAALFNFGFGAFIWLFLAITQPFGIYNNNVSAPMLWLLLLPIGLIWVVFSFGVDWVGKRWLRLPLRDNYRLDWWVWAVKMAILVHVIFIIRGLLCDWECVDTGEYFEAWLAFFIIFSFFYLPFTFYAKYRFFHGMLGEGGAEKNNLTLTGETKEVLRLHPEKLVYLQADDNYVALWTRDEQQDLKKIYFRASLKSVEGQLKERSEFVRIHRSYIINSNYFNDYKKGENALLLKWGTTEMELPVSQKYKHLVAALFVRPK